VPPRAPRQSVARRQPSRDGSMRRGKRFLDCALRAPLGMTGAVRCPLAIQKLCRAARFT
jgi:hypothetical protein